MFPAERQFFRRHTELSNLPKRSSIAVEERVEVPLAGLQEKNISIIDGVYRVPLPYGKITSLMNQTVETVHCLLTSPAWVNDNSHPKYLRLCAFAKTVGRGIDLEQRNATVGTILYWGLRENQIPALSEPLLRFLTQPPEYVAQVLKNNRQIRTEHVDAAFLTLPDSGEILEIPEGDSTDSARKALITLALLADDPQSGPEQVLRFLYNASTRSSQFRRRNSSNTDDSFLDSLVSQSVAEHNFLWQATSKASQIKEKMRVFETHDAIASSIGSLITVIAEEASNTHAPSSEILESTRLQNKILNQQYYHISKKKPNLVTKQEVLTGEKSASPEDKKRFTREELSRALQNYLTIQRAQMTLEGATSEQYLHALLQFQRGIFKLDEINTYKRDVKLAMQKEVSELSHQEVALILSMEMEILSRPIGTTQLFRQPLLEQQVLEVAEKIHEYGLYFINSKLSDVHNPMNLHMSNGQLCLTHTPAQLVMLSNLASRAQNMTSILQTATPRARINFSMPLDFGTSLIARSVLSIGSSSAAGIELMSNASAKQKSTKSKLKLTQESRIIKKMAKERPLTLLTGTKRQDAAHPSKKIERKNKKNIQTQGIEKSKKSDVVAVKKNTPTKPKLHLYYGPAKEVHNIQIIRKRRIKNEVAAKVDKIKIPAKKIFKKSMVLPRAVNKQNRETNTNGFIALPLVDVVNSIQQTKKTKSFSIKKHTVFKSKRKLLENHQVLAINRNEGIQLKKSMAQSIVAIGVEKIRPAVRLATKVVLNASRRMQKVSLQQTSKKSELVQLQNDIENTFTKTVREKKHLQKIRQVNVSRVMEKKNKRLSDVDTITTSSENEFYQNTVVEKSEKDEIAMVDGLGVKKNVGVKKDAIVHTKVDVSFAENLALEDSSSVNSTIEINAKINAVNQVEDISRLSTKSYKHVKKSAKSVALLVNTRASNTMITLPTHAIVDVSDSFNTAREVKMWIQEAIAYPRLIERYYAT